MTEDSKPNDEQPELEAAELNEEALGESTDYGDEDDVFADDEEMVLGMGESDEEESEGEFSPNDIFGLDPLDVLTLEELADYLKVEPGVLKRVIKDQNLPGRNIGGEWRFLRDAVANWLRGQEEPAQQQKKARQEFADAGESSAPADKYERPRQRFSEGGQQSGYRGNQQGGGGQYDRGRYGDSGQSYSRPPRRPFRSGGGDEAYGENSGGSGGGYRDRGEGNRSGGYGSGGGGGYSGGNYGGGGGYSSGGGYGGGGGGYGGGGYSGGARKKSKRHVFDNERAKRLDRRKDQGGDESQ